MHAMDEIHDRMESPADRMLRIAGARSNYLVLPLFAFANAGVVIEPGVVAGHEPLMLAITLALVLGKPDGMFGFSALEVRLGLANKHDAYSWPQVPAAGAMSGLGFTMTPLLAHVPLPAPQKRTPAETG